MIHRKDAKRNEEMTPHTKTRILLVDDDRSLVKFVSANLKARNYEVIVAQNGQAALDVLTTQMPDLIILDLMMPKVDGLQVAREVRRVGDVPIIVLSAIGDESKKVELLDSGVDDSLTKPFWLQELLARVRAVLRRTSDRNQERLATQRLKHENMIIDFSSKQLWVDDADVRLTPTEFDLLALLLHHAGRVLTHDMLLSNIWGEAYRGNNQYLHIYIGRLRQKLVAVTGLEIVTYPGVGYSLQLG